MLTATGRHIFGKLTEQGRAVFALTTETGEYGRGKALTGSLASFMPMAQERWNLTSVNGLAGENNALAQLELPPMGISLAHPGIMSAGPGTLSAPVVLSVTAAWSSLQMIPPMSAMAAGVLNLVAGGGLSHPSGIGRTSAISAPLQHGIFAHAHLSATGQIGLGGSHSGASSPLRLAAGGAAAISCTASLDGSIYTAALVSTCPMTSYTTAAASAPLALANPVVINAQYSVTISADTVDITQLVSSCTLTRSEADMYDTVSIDIPDGTRWPLDNPPSEICVTLPWGAHTYMVEEMTASEAQRSIWGRPTSAMYSDPWASTLVFNERNTLATSASELAAEIIPLTTWTAHDFPLPPRWEISGTPSAALQELAAAAGGTAFGMADGTVTVRPSWPVRPVDMITGDISITRENALELTVSRSDRTPYGSVIVNGWSPEDMLPEFDVEGSPELGKPAYVRLYWKGPDHPSFTDFITSGNAQYIGTVSETLTETVVFSDGVGSVDKPIWQIIGTSWVGKNYGTITWLNGGYSTELELLLPGNGVARVTYQTSYERWKLTGQDVETVLFGVQVGVGSVSAQIALASGGASAGEVKQALLGSVAGCVAYGTSYLDESRVRYTVNATIPAQASVTPGMTAWIDDELSGVRGFGKITSVETAITASRMTHNLTIAL